MVAAEFTQRSAVIVEANLRIAAECSRLLERFRSAGIRLLFVKGLSLAALAYPNPFLKMGWDIDSLIDPADIAPAAALLRREGYAPHVPADADDPGLRQWHRLHKESVWEHESRGFILDLHTRLADHPDLIPDLTVDSASQEVGLSELALPTLARDELFAYLCVHGASSAWFRLKWVLDLVALLHHETPAGIARLYRRSRQLGAGRAADQTLLLAHRLFALPMDRELLTRLQSSRASRLLARIAERELCREAEPKDRFLGTAMIHLSQPLLLPGTRFKLSELARQLRSMGGAAA